MENANTEKNTKVKNQLAREKMKTRGFYFSVAVLPLTQFILFYICVNFNSILLALKTYNVDMQVTAVGFQNFKQLFFDISVDNLLPHALRNSLVAFTFNVVVGMTCGMIFSYYIYKKMPAHNFFKVVLFMPSIVSSIVMTIVFKNFVDVAVPEMVKVFGVVMEEGLYSNSDTIFGTLIFYNLWVGFGPQILMYVGAMNNVSDGATEAAMIDGANAFREFIHVVFPTIYPTFIVFVTTNIAAIFTNQMNLFSFEGTGADNRIITIGYYLYKETQRGSLISNYSYLAAMGIVCTVIALPVVLGVRWLLTKFGPSED